MNTSKLLLSILFSFISLLIITAAALSVFPACNLKIFGNFVFDCSEAVDKEILSDQYPDQSVENLLKRIRNLEVQLATKSCAYVEYEKKEFDLPEILKKTDLDAGKRKDLGALAGCWSLTGSAQEFSPVGCEEGGGTMCPITLSSNAIYCFDTKGSGSVKTEIDSNFCTAPLQAKFNEANQLQFQELSHQICPIGTKRSDGSNFGKIVPRSYTCKLTVDNRAECDVVESTEFILKKIILVRTQDE
jgi:hypothetical protein